MDARRWVRAASLIVWRPMQPKELLIQAQAPPPPIRICKGLGSVFRNQGAYKQVGVKLRVSAPARRQSHSQRCAWVRLHRYRISQVGVALELIFQQAACGRRACCTQEQQRAASARRRIWAAAMLAAAQLKIPVLSDTI